MLSLSFNFLTFVSVNLSEIRSLKTCFIASTPISNLEDMNSKIEVDFSSLSEILFNFSLKSLFKIELINSSLFFILSLISCARFFLFL